MSHAPNPKNGRIQVVAAGLLWSLGGVFVKSLETTPALIAATRGLFAALVLLPFVRRWPTRNPRVLVSSVLLYTGVVGLFVWSTKLTSAANAIVLQYTAPAFVFLLLLALGKKPPKRDRLTLAGGMLGITIIYFGASAGDFMGISLAVFSGFLFASWMVVLGAADDVDPVSMTVANNLGATLLLLPFAITTTTTWPRPPQVLALAVMGALQLGIPYLLFTRGVRQVGAQEASLLVLVEPVLNPIWVAIVIGEIPGTYTLAGGGVVLLTLVLRYAGALSRSS